MTEEHGLMQKRTMHVSDQAEQLPNPSPPTHIRHASRPDVKPRGQLVAQKHKLQMFCQFAITSFLLAISYEKASCGQIMKCWSYSSNQCFAQ